MSETVTLNDLLLVSDKLDHLIAPKGGEAFLRYMLVARYLRITSESVADQWVEVYGEPDVASHELFVSGLAPEGKTFTRCVVRFGMQPVALPFGAERETNFYVEIQGTPYTDVTGKFKNKFKDILLARPETLLQAAGPLREARPVAEDEKPKTKEKRERGNAQAGTRVEEW